MLYFKIIIIYIYHKINWFISLNLYFFHLYPLPLLIFKVRISREIPVRYWFALYYFNTYCISTTPYPNAVLAPNPYISTMHFTASSILVFPASSNSCYTISTISISTANFHVKNWKLLTILQYLITAFASPANFYDIGNFKRGFYTIKPHDICHEYILFPYIHWQARYAMVKCKYRKGGMNICQ